MRFHRWALILIGMAMPLALGVGCASLSRDRPVAVLVRDAETKQPIPQAHVLVSSAAGSASITLGQAVLTQADGHARLSVAPPHNAGLIVEASASGYSADSQTAASATVEAIKPLGWFESADKRSPTFVLELYSGEPFSFELVVPPGYRGLVKAKVQVEEGVVFPAGQRRFRYDVPPSGVVEIKGPSAFRQILPAGFHAVYADGKPLTDAMDGTTVGFRWLRHDGDEQDFVVGTKPEFDEIARNLNANAQMTEFRSNGSGQGKGGGRHGGKGGGGRGGGGGGPPVQ